jgi:hypothetical protein
MYKTRADKRTIFTTLDGIEIPFIPFSWDEFTLSKEGLKDEYRQRGEIVDCPQYTVTFAGGTTQKFDHNANTVKEVPPGTLSEDRERVIAEQVETWEKYLDASKRLEAQANEELAEVVLSESLAGVTLPPDTAWEERQRKRHVKIPTDPEEKRRHYIFTVLLKSKSDQIDIISTITAVSMGVVKEDDLEKVKASFRNSIWRDGLSGLPGRDAAGEVEDPEVGPLDGQPPADLGEGSQSVAIDEGTV